MRYKYYVKKNEKKLMYFCITGRLELWISRIICICCNVPNIPSLPAVSNSFFLPTSTTPYFRSALSRTIIIQFHTDIHLLYVVAQIWKTASSFFLKIWLFLCFTFIFNIFYVSTINRKFTSMDAGSWRTSRWRPFYSSVPRSTYSSFTDVLKSRVNTYLINT